MYHFKTLNFHGFQENTVPSLLHCN